MARATSAIPSRTRTLWDIPMTPMLLNGVEGHLVREAEVDGMDVAAPTMAGDGPGQETTTRSTEGPFDWPEVCRSILEDFLTRGGGPWS